MLIRARAMSGILTCLALAQLACVGSFNVIAPAIAEGREKLGPAQGSACGSLGIAGTAYYFIPIAINSRTARAYQRAIASVAGATALVNPTIEEYWFWWVVATTRCTTVRGEAVR